MAKFTGVSTLALAAALLATSAFAADADGAAGAATDVSAVIVTGTRVTGMKAEDSAAPIELVGKEALTKTGSPDLANALASSVPSLNVQAGGGDTAALTVQAALRGLNPNDTLVLINGKRRHTTANLSVDGGSSYSGSATTDLSYIPVSAIDHIEVLQDGAAAQYGSDAIAGVVNIILKNTDHGGAVSATGGEYYRGDGQTGAWSINRGFSLGEKGYLNFTVEQRTHADSVLGIGGRSYSTPTGAPLPNALLSSNATIAAQMSAGVTASGVHFNKVNGDPSYDLYSGMINAGYDLGTVQLYGFASYGQRTASHYENYRGAQKAAGPNSLGVLTFALPNGFDPSEQFKETDFSGTVGAKGVVAGWNFDLSTSYGQNRDNIATINSANDELWKFLQAASPTFVAPQRNFNDGAFVNTEAATTLDLDKEFNIGLAGPLNVAIGVEGRRDSFQTIAGEPSSYYGAGAQSFTGYTPLDQGTHNRTNAAIYTDLSVKPIANLLVDLAGRYEHFSDFGSTEVGKLTARYDFSTAFALRGTISSGFRAPTLAEEYYSGTNVSPTSAEVQLPPNSPQAQLAGFSKLHPEQSNNYSLGFVAHPMPKLQITGDIYQISIRDRIVVSGLVYGANGNTIVSQAVENAITARGVTLESGLSYSGIAVFTNGANTRTTGAELTANYASDFENIGHVDWSVGMNYNSTKITKLVPLPLAVQNVGFGQVNLLNLTSTDALTTAVPKEKVILNALYTGGKWTVNLRGTIYGPTSQHVTSNGSYVGPQAMDQKIDTTGIIDLDVAYKVTDAVKLDIGANNLLDTKPPTTPNYTGSNGYPRPVGGAQVFNLPYGFAPWGGNGGYYYVRATYTF